MHVNQLESLVDNNRCI